MVAPAWGSCKKDRLCDRVDPDLIALVPRRAIEVYDDLSRKIEIGHFAATEAVLSMPAFPASVDAFVALTLHLHALIFQNALPAFAGRFRTDDVEFGGDGGHRLIGAPPSQVESRLRELHARVQLAVFSDADADASLLARECAIFLERFFRIHPFPDGNGRVGRILVRLACEASGRWYLRPFDRSAKGRRAYLHALEYAHKHAAESDHPGARRMVNPCRGLARWLAMHLEEKPLDAAFEAEPPNEGQIDAGEVSNPPQAPPTPAS